MLKALSKLLFKVSGWKLIGEMPEGCRKAVMIAAPHTSYWDLVYARAAFFMMDIPVRYTIKKEMMKSPLAPLLKSLGAIPIDRQKVKTDGIDQKESLTEAMVRLFEKREELVVLVTPEGTRKRVETWKSGFYYVALGANVPIILGFLDYKTKEAGIGPAIIPSGNWEEDIEKIMSFYRNKTAKHPEQGVF
jgi:1-acyl-sn-glycerol-3-phosphate acyltransferase